MRRIRHSQTTIDHHWTHLNYPKRASRDTVEQGKTTTGLQAKRGNSEYWYRNTCLTLTLGSSRWKQPTSSYTQHTHCPCGSHQVMLCYADTHTLSCGSHHVMLCYTDFSSCLTLTSNCCMFLCCTLYFCFSNDALIKRA